MKLEVLFPQICNLYGDLFNVKLLSESSPEVEVVETKLNEIPLFSKENVDMIYMGPMSEHSQELVIKALAPYKTRIEELIDNGTVFLFTGNAGEVFCKYIETDDGDKIEGLGLFDFYSVRKMMKRHNSRFLGKFNDLDVVGFKSQFTMMYGDNSHCAFLEAQRGIGLNQETRLEGIRKNNFFSTYLIGPLFVLNPELLRHFLELTGVKDYEIPYLRDLEAAYNKRKEEFINLP